MAEISAVISDLSKIHKNIRASFAKSVSDLIAAIQQEYTNDTNQVDTDIIEISESINRLRFNKNLAHHIETFCSYKSFYEAVIPDFDCIILVNYNENKIDLIVNYTAKSLLDAGMLNERNCRIYQEHKPPLCIIYSSYEDYRWQNYRIKFGFEFVLDSNKLLYNIVVIN